MDLLVNIKSINAILLVIIYWQFHWEQIIFQISNSYGSLLSHLNTFQSYFKSEWKRRKKVGMFLKTKEQIHANWSKPQKYYVWEFRFYWEVYFCSLCIKIPNYLYYYLKVSLKSSFIFLYGWQKIYLIIFEYPEIYTM